MHRKILSTSNILASIALVGLSWVHSSAYAMPTVSGLTITWPDDGYYQVQNASDLTTVCEDTRQCDVTAGEYIVINHTTGQRFEGIVVGDGSSGHHTDSFEVVGNTIRFPEGDWYQVQDQITYASLCNGELVCALDPGIYIVINHTLGQRFEDVAVGMSDDPGQPPRVNGNVISWSDDGWYQVQTSDSFISVCQGGRSCTVSPGNYRVINLTIGTRYENILVESGDPTNPPNPEPVPAGTFPARISAQDAILAVSVDPEPTLPADARLAGDVNGDGLEDLIIILPGEQPFQTSAAIVFADGEGSYPDLPLPSGVNAGADTVLSNGFMVDDVSPRLTGIGDVNNDGFDDLSLESSGFFTLAERVVLAGASSFPARISTAELSDSQLLVKLPISATLSEAGDINGDGIADLYVAGPSDVTGGVIYGSSELDIAFNTRADLRDISLFPGCGFQFCSTLPVGDFDNDGFDDLFVSRFGANDCGFASYTAVVYGRADGITPRRNFTDYATDEITRIVGEDGGDCYPQSTATPMAIGDVDGDGATDLILSRFFPDESRFLLFGLGDGRRAALSIDELDGQRGLTIPGDLDLVLDDVNDDGFDDVIFPEGNAYLGFSRDISSIDAPVVRRTPTTFIISVPEAVASGSRVFTVTINDTAAGQFDATSGEITVDDITAGMEAVIVVTLVSADNQPTGTLRRTVPAYPNSENLTANLLAPRLVELTFNGDPATEFYSNYLVWRNGIPIGRSISGADNFIDQDLTLGTSYTYYITPDYLFDESTDATSLLTFPLIQRQSNSVTVITPEI